MPYEIKKTEGPLPDLSSRPKGRFKYPFDKVEPGQHFDVKQFNKRPSKDSIRVLCAAYKYTWPHKTFVHDYIGQPDANGDKTIRVWCIAPEG